MTTPCSIAFDHWIRNDFKAINTKLEELYFQHSPKDQIDGLGDNLKQQLLHEGKAFVSRLLLEGNTDEGFDSGFDLLGNVGFYMAACRRHDLTEPSRETKSPLEEASALAMQLGASLGVIPRFASAHLETHNRATDGIYKTFTQLEDEKIFLDNNTRAVFAYIRASESLLHILPLGISHPATADLLRAAKSALEDVARYNSTLFENLDTQRFFYCVRPYYKPHRVGLHEYRGANAGDFAGINIIDLLLGLCRADDPYYSQLLVDKFLFMRPQDQRLLRDCMRRESLLNSFLKHASSHSNKSWYQDNLALFLQVCDAHGHTATQHHEQLIKKFIETPADQDDLTEQRGLTASGPPLPALLRGLKKLCDLRNAAPSDTIPTRYADFQTLRATLNG